MWFVPFRTEDFELYGGPIHAMGNIVKKTFERKTGHPDLAAVDHLEPCLQTDSYTNNMGSSVNGIIPTNISYNHHFPHLNFNGSLGV